MGLSPFGLTVGNTHQNIKPAASVGSANLSKSNSPNLPNNKVASINESLTTVKNSSLLYQLISRLLLTPEQDNQLSESLSKSIDIDNNTNNTLSSTSGDFSLVIEASVLTINQQSLTITNEFGSFTETTTIVESVNIRLEVFMSNPSEEADPLILDVNGDGFSTTGIQKAAQFDINADGHVDQLSVPVSDDAFLAVDFNLNGKIDNGLELFGDQRGYENGFENLSSYDDNHDGIINADDAIFNSLLMLRLVGSEQFITELHNTDIHSINLDYKNISAETIAGDKIVQLSDYQSSADTSHHIADLLLQYKSGLKP